MAVSDAYATPQFYRASIDKSDAEDDLVIQQDLLAVSRYIEMRLGDRFFNQEGTVSVPVARTYMPRSGRVIRSDWAETENPWKYGGLSRCLDIDDLVSVSSIAVDEQHDNTFNLALAAADYELLPRNSLLGPEPRPYHQIELTPYGTRYAWTRGARVRVSGVWGWPSVPTPIVAATVQLTAILRLESPRATRTMTEMGAVLGMSARGAAIVDDLIINYGKPPA